LSVSCVLSHHDNVHACGVAKFSAQLASRLGVPFHQLMAAEFKYPLVSVKCAEGPAPRMWTTYDLFLHDIPKTAEWWGMVACAVRVFVANPAIGAAVHGRSRRLPITAWCPSTIAANLPRSGLRILCFGMSHKLQLPLYKQLKAVLDASHVDYTVNLSCAVHEGSRWEQTIGEAAERLRPIFGVHFRLLGFLADDALVEEMKRSSGVALFYDPAVRANNTTLWAALEQGCPVVTNLDADSPPELQHEVNVWDIAQMSEWPMAERARVLRAGGRKVAEAYSWERLLEVLR